jgi:hypothetical protein
MNEEEPVPEIAVAYIDITVKGVDELRKRLEGAQGNIRKLWHRKCECSCGCAIQHPGRQDRCVLCLGGDHWGDLDTYLAKIEARRTA